MSAAKNLTYFASVLLVASLCSCSEENPRVLTRFNVKASLRGPLPWNPLQGRVITSWVDQLHGTMSTLYGNDPAVDSARESSQHAYPPGAILALVTWHQEEDERWFGAKIPSVPQAVEFVTVQGMPDGSAKYSYQEFQGNPLQPSSVESESTSSQRVAYILSQRASVLP